MVKEVVLLEYTSENGVRLTSAYPHDAGYDLPVSHPIGIEPGGSVDVSTGIRVAIPEGYYGRITGRSSAHRKRRLTVREGIIDSGFRGELFAYVTNENPSWVTLQETDHVAQLIICPLPPTELKYLGIGAKLPPSVRGENGFGSSGQ